MRWRAATQVDHITGDGGMILYNLQCAEGHGFEVWFRNGAAYDQRAPGSLSCPVCGGTQVTKAPMAPRIARSRGEGARGEVSRGEEIRGEDARGEAAAPATPHVALPALPPELTQQLQELRKKVEASCDYVGERFAEEARRIHYGETKAHDIYGEASSRDAKELREEGVAFHQVPWLPRTNS